MASTTQDLLLMAALESVQKPHPALNRNGAREKSLTAAKEKV